MSSTEQTPVTLDEVIAFVERIHPDAEPLLHLEDAVVVGQRLEQVGDDVVGHFVHRAREEGATWSAIGERMGVTKQAAQQRFVVALADHEDGLLSRFTPRARQTLAAAREAARSLGADEVGTVHLVLGLATEPEGIAMEVVTELGVTAEQLRAAAALEAPAAPTVAPTRPVVFASEARATLQLAVEQALRLGHNYVGTEHLLLAILAAPDTAGARLLTGLGVTRRKATTRVKQSLARIVAQRTGRSTT